MSTGLYSQSPEFKVNELKVKNKDSSLGGKIQVFEGANNGVNKISVVAADSLAADYTVTLPSATGTLVVSGGGGALASSDITGQSAATVATDDLLVISDTSASGALKKVTTQSVADLFAPTVTATNSVTLTNKTLTSPTINGGTFTGGTDIVVADGGTGLSATTAYAVLCGGTTSTGALQSIAGVGTSGQVLTSNGAAALPTFQTVASSGGMTLISTLTASNSATLAVTGLAAGYKAYMVDITDLLAQTGAAGSLVQFEYGTGVTPTYQTTHNYSNIGSRTSASSTLTQSNSTANGQFGYIVRTNSTFGTSDRISGQVYFMDLSGTHKVKNYWSQFAIELNGSVGCEYGDARGAIIDTTPITALRFSMTSTNMASGTIKIYGIN